MEIKSENNLLVPIALVGSYGMCWFALSELNKVLSSPNATFFSVGLNAYITAASFQFLADITNGIFKNKD